MLAFCLNNYSDIIRLYKSAPDLLFSIESFNKWGFNFLLSSIFLIGYSLESKVLNNQIKSVDPTLLGWVVTLICYPPFNTALDSFLLKDTAPTNTLFTMTHYQFILLVLSSASYGVYLWATIALWTKASDLTNRGIISHGPYRYVRHPAYICKNIAWWIFSVPYINSIYSIFPLIAWSIIYIMRALTEERHLLSDPEYQKYVKKVK